MNSKTLIDFGQQTLKRESTLLFFQFTSQLMGAWSPTKHITV